MRAGSQSSMVPRKRIRRTSGTPADRTGPSVGAFADAVWTVVVEGVVDMVFLFCSCSNGPPRCGRSGVVRAEGVRARRRSR